MRVAIIGLGHLGYITAACVRDHFDFSIWDPDPETLKTLRAGKTPFDFKEPGLPGSFSEALVHHCAPSLQAAIDGADIVWITYDTPVDKDDNADYDYVAGRVQETFPYLTDGQTLLISSQVRIGFTRRMQTIYRKRYSDRKQVVFAHSPENIRRGKGLWTFCHQERILIGRDDLDRPLVDEVLRTLFTPFSTNLLYMSMESAEMSKHALNSWLAMSITFANEVADISRRFGADSVDVERALKSEGRIGDKAYLRAGEPYTGPLARDIAILVELGRSLGNIDLPEAIQNSNRGRILRQTQLKSAGS